MGCYINPKIESKEEFLAREGKQISEQEMMCHEFNEEQFLCALVDNGISTAAIICYPSF